MRGTVRLPALSVTATEFLLGLIPAAAAGYALGTHSRLLIPIVAGVVGLWLFVSPPLAAVALGVSLPYVKDITNGHLGVHVAVSDLLLVVLAARVVGDGLLRRVLPALRALRPLRLPLGQYAWLLLLLAAIHPGVSSILKTGQRFELFLGPLLIGAYLALRRDHVRVLKGYVIASTALAVAWPLDLFHLQAYMQKNPTGQFLTNAILLLFALKELRRFVCCLPFLVVGLFLTGSRGAILALVVGGLVISLVHARDRTRALKRALPVIVTVIVAFVFLPASLQNRFTNLRPSQTTAAGHTISIRDQYWKDAEALIARHPWYGIGVGNYSAGEMTLQTVTTDPHNVILREAAEGGIAFAASFVLLVLGTLAVLWRSRQLPLSAAAIGILVATFTHGLVDVFWVRGTPILAWLLVGMVVGLARREPAPQAT